MVATISCITSRSNRGRRGWSEGEQTSSTGQKIFVQHVGIIFFNTSTVYPAGAVGGTRSRSGIDVALTWTRTSFILFNVGKTIFNSFTTVMVITMTITIDIELHTTATTSCASGNLSVERICSAGSDFIGRLSSYDFNASKVRNDSRWRRRWLLVGASVDGRGGLERSTDERVGREPMLLAATDFLRYKIFFVEKRWTHPGYARLERPNH